MNLSNDQEQIAHLKKNNERLTILCIILGMITIAAGLYARMQKSIADENIHIAAIEAKRGAEEKQRAQLAGQEAIRQRAIAEEMAIQLAKLRNEKTKNTK